MNTRIEKQEEIDGHGSWWIYADEQRAGLMDYSVLDEATIRIDHTEVDQRFSGKGFGRILVMAAVEDARKHSYKIIPACSYAGNVFLKTPELKDVLP